MSAKKTNKPLVIVRNVPNGVYLEICNQSKEVLFTSDTFLVREDAIAWLKSEYPKYDLREEEK